jgi:SAM-dependent methyltransferase
MVNLGCGSRFHRDWVNFDLTPAGDAVRRANFIDGIPLPDAAASCVYHSHVLEHLPLDVARRFLTECHRVLAPGGILRVVVPDLEQSARDYLDVLDRRRRRQGGSGSGSGGGGGGDGGDVSPVAHRWMMLEMFDQMVRNKPGGEWSQALAQGAGDDPFVRPRLGAFGVGLANALRGGSNGAAGRGTLKQRVFRRLLCVLPRRLGDTLAEVRYRRAGELHLWMYDELFLRDVLEQVGFTQVRRMTAQTSDIPDFARYGLDVEPDGTPWKGVSLYVEARKGARA